MDKPLFIGYYTADGKYKDLALNMQRSVSDFKRDSQIEEMPRWCDYEGLKPPIPWVLGISLCPFFIWKMIKQHPDRPLVYLDADAEVVKDPVWFDTLAADVDAAFLFKGPGIVSNVIYIGPTDGAKDLVMRWMVEQDKANRAMLKGRVQSSYAWDQAVVSRLVMRRHAHYKIEKIPLAYGKRSPLRGKDVMPEVKDEDVVIWQYQESRNTPLKHGDKVAG